MSEFPALQERRVLWQTACGGVAVIAAGLGGLIWQQASAVQATIPVWPAYAFGVVALIGLYCVFAPVIHFWPFRPSSEPVNDPLPVRSQTPAPAVPLQPRRERTPQETVDAPYPIDAFRLDAPSECYRTPVSPEIHRD